MYFRPNEIIFWEGLDDRDKKVKIVYGKYYISLMFVGRAINGLNVWKKFKNDPNTMEYFFSCSMEDEGGSSEGLCIELSAVEKLYNGLSAILKNEKDDFAYTYYVPFLLMPNGEHFTIKAKRINNGIELYLRIWDDICDYISLTENMTISRFGEIVVVLKRVLDSFPIVDDEELARFLYESESYDKIPSCFNDINYIPSVEEIKSFSKKQLDCLQEYVIYDVWDAINNEKDVEQAINRRKLVEAMIANEMAKRNEECASYLKSKCPNCGADGEILLTSDRRYIVRCKNCKKSTWAYWDFVGAVLQWNCGSCTCMADDI